MWIKWRQKGLKTMTLSLYAGLGEVEIILVGNRSNWETQDNNGIHITAEVILY